MNGKKEERQFYSVVVLAVIVMAISVWAFIQGVTAPDQEGILQSNMAGEESKPQKEETEAEPIDTEALAQAALENISFDTELSLMEDSVAESMIVTASEKTKVQLYMGEGTCADELLIITAASQDEIEDEIESVQQHLSDMQQSFQDYLPKEAKKIDDAVILQTKNYIVSCVSSDADNAKKVIEEQLK